MGFIIFALSIFILYKIWQDKKDREPLSDVEIKRLSEARRADYINSHFRIDTTRATVNPRYRESLAKFGRWDKVSIEYSKICPLITDLLKYKRHEWSVWVLANEHEGKFIWANKGDDNESCYFMGDMAYLIELAHDNDCNTVIHFHNHPHTQDRYWNLLSPSKTDIDTLEKMKVRFDAAKLNYISGLCSQGRFIIYGQMFYSSFYPGNSKTASIVAVINGEKANKELHKELRRIGNTKIKPLY